MRLGGRGIAVLCFCAASCSTSPRTSKGLVPIRVRVLDSVGTPVHNATVTLIRGLHQELAAGATDSSGVLCFCGAFIFSTDYQVVVRKTGFAPSRQFTKLTLVDSLKVDVVLLPATGAADTSAARAPNRIDAETIAAGSQRMQNAFDLIRLLRPGMLPVRDRTDACEPIAHVWVNGQHVLSPNEGTATRPRTSASSLGRVNPFEGVSLQVRSALTSIKPEHVAAVEYRDCHDAAEVRSGRNNALFVSLKHGVQFDESLGSYVSRESPQRTAVLPPLEEQNVTNVRGAAAVRLIERLELYRYRILGLFDGDTGAPIEGAEIRELATGTTALTSPTGTVSLAFMRDGGGPVVLSKAGYKADIVTVMITPRDTTWLTYVLYKAP